MSDRVFQKVGEVKNGGTVIGTLINYQGEQAVLPKPVAVTRHRAALQEELEDGAQKRWGGMSVYIREEGAVLLIETSPYGTPGTGLLCPNGSKAVRLNPFTINADWLPVAKAWRGE